MARQPFTKEVIDTDLWHMVHVKQGDTKLTVDETVAKLNEFSNEIEKLQFELADKKIDTDFIDEVLEENKILKHRFNDLKHEIHKLKYELKCATVDTDCATNAQYTELLKENEKLKQQIKVYIGPNCKKCIHYATDTVSACCTNPNSVIGEWKPFPYEWDYEEGAKNCNEYET